MHGKWHIGFGQKRDEKGMRLNDCSVRERSSVECCYDREDGSAKSCKINTTNSHRTLRWGRHNCHTYEVKNRKFPPLNVILSRYCLPHVRELYQCHEYCASPVVPYVLPTCSNTATATYIHLRVLLLRLSSNLCASLWSCRCRKGRRKVLRFLRLVIE